MFSRDSSCEYLLRTAVKQPGTLSLPPACFLIYQDEETGLITGKITARVRFSYNGSTADIYDRHHAMQNVKNEASFQGDRKSVV